MPIGPAPHVKLAVVDGDLVLLDLSRDSYLAVARDYAGESLQALLGCSHNESDPVLMELLAEGVLQPGASRWTPDLNPRPGPLPDMPDECRQLRLAMPFLRAAVTSYFALRNQDAHWVEVPPIHGCARNVSPEQMAGIVDHFEKWRILIPGSGRCLVQSMILMRFLALIKIKAEWVFGVRTHPFEAHCWVEWRSMVLNDSVDHVSWYTVIARL